MKAGRELDALIAEKVMGWARAGGCNWLVPPKGDERINWAAEWDENGLPHWLPEYSTDISAAWTVMENVYKRDIYEPHAFRIYGPLSDGYKVTLVWEHHDGPIEIKSFVAATAPLAICLAALESVGLPANTGEEK